MYRTIRTIHRYDTIHMIRIYVSDDSLVLTIHSYDTKPFVHDTIRIAYHISYDTDNYAKGFCSMHKFFEWIEVPNI